LKKTLAYKSTSQNEGTSPGLTATVRITDYHSWPSDQKARPEEEQPSVVPVIIADKKTSLLSDRVF
jgi:hypothetical protein